MLFNVKPRMDEPEVQEVLACAVFPDPEEIQAVMETYRRNESHSLFGYASEGDLVAVAGFRAEPQRKLVIQHMAVHPHSRGAGFGRGILLEMLEAFKPKQIIVETDEVTVDFFRNVGFRVESLGISASGIERFQCIYDAEAEE
ncbi:GNAT family acetyltransferase [Paenibacillus swuensis]|uniref:GNAT family acetyltransferase n=1 Tax=Paenibacillus swuensis TaxID=1178515 RepID=A0A172TL03_9BACL|nr:GNAT family N-acetyltransferase [Paenibacillus swuensis]ANE47497.1 GNAT family acetyltransferase [Paenibacillus swuensis]